LQAEIDVWSKHVASVSTLAAEEQWQDNNTRCMMCDSNEAEDIEHFVMRCVCYRKHIAKLFTRVREAYLRGTESNFNDLNQHEQLCVILGADGGNKKAENKIDHAAKRFLQKAWKARRKVVVAINRAFNMSDLVVTKQKRTPLGSD
jgi:hypothetical protein